MRILHFTHTFIPIYGGTTTRLINLLKDDGNEHIIITPGLKSKYVPQTVDFLAKEEAIDNFWVRRVELPFSHKADKKFLEFFTIPNGWKFDAKRLIENAQDMEIDIVYGHNPIEFALAAMEKANKEKKPFIIECHGLMKDTLYTSRNKIKNVYYQVLNKYLMSFEEKILKNAKKVIVQTNNMKARVINEFNISENNIEIIYNGVDIGHFNFAKNQKYRSEIRTKMNWQEKDVVVGYFGFLDDNNGILDLLKIFNNLMNKVANLKLLLIGRGPYAKQCEEASKRNPNILYLGMVPYEDVPKYYSAIDVFTIPRPSNPATESLVPMKIFEAMAMKKLVIVSNVKGLTEIIRHERNGLVFQSHEQFKQILQTIHNYPEINSLVEQAYKDVLQKYTWEVARSKLTKIYNEVR